MPAPVIVALGVGLAVSCGEPSGPGHDTSLSSRPLVVGIDMDELARQIRPDARRKPSGSPFFLTRNAFGRDWGIQIEYRYDCRSCSKGFSLAAGLHASLSASEEVVRGGRQGNPFPGYPKRGEFMRTRDSCYAWIENALVKLELWIEDPAELEHECNDLERGLAAPGVMKYGRRFPDRPALEVRRKAEGEGLYVVDFRVKMPEGSYILPEYVDESNERFEHHWHRLWYPRRLEDPTALSIGAPNAVVWSWLPRDIPGDAVHLPDRAALKGILRRDELRRRGVLPTEQEKWAMVDKVFKGGVGDLDARGLLWKLEESCDYRPCPELAAVFESLMFGGAGDFLRSDGLLGLPKAGKTEIALALARGWVLDSRHPLGEASWHILEHYGTIEDRAISNRENWNTDDPRWCADGGLSDPELVAKWRQQATWRAEAKARELKEQKELGF